MHIEEPIETHGYFWLAGNPDDTFTGILSISDKGEASLEIFVTFESPYKALSQQFTEEKLRILGVADKAGAVTLIDCLILQQNTVMNTGDVLSKSRLHVGCVFFGAHFDTEDISFSQMTFSVEGLDEWFSFHYRPFSTGRDLPGQSSFTYTQPESITLQISDDLILRFDMSVTTKLGRLHTTVTSKMGISIESSRPRSFTEFMQVLQHVKNFLCLAFDRTVSFTSLSGLQQEPDGSYNAYDTVDIYGRFDPYDLPTEDISPGHFLISFEDIVQNIHEYLPRWLKRYEEYEPTFNLYFAVTANHYMHLEGRFLFLVHGIESLHRRSSSETTMPTEEFNSLLDIILEYTPEQQKQWLLARLKYANELSLRKRLLQMIAPFEDLFGTGNDRAAFVNQIVTTRNYLTHYDYGIQNDAVTEPRELLQLYSKLEGLVQLRLLDLLGFDNQHIRRIVGRFLPLKQKLNIE